MLIELKKFGEILTSRPSGREAYLAMQAYTLKGLSKDEPIEIDFAGVKVLAPSWADEVITKLAENFKNVKLLNTENSSVQATLETLRKYSGLKVIEIKIKFGDPVGFYLGMEEFHDDYNSIIKSIKKNSENSLKIRLLKKNGTSEAYVYIRTTGTGEEKFISDKILISNKIIGKTLNELKNTKIEDL